MAEALPRLRAVRLLRARRRRSRCESKQAAERWLAGAPCHAHAAELSQHELTSLAQVEEEKEEEEDLGFSLFD